MSDIDEAPRRGVVRPFDARPLRLSGGAFWRDLRRDTLTAWPDAVYGRHDLLLETAGRRLLVATSPGTVSRVLMDRDSPWGLSDFQKRQLEPVLGGSLVLADGPDALALRRRVAGFFPRVPEPRLGALAADRLGRLSAHGSDDLEADLSRAVLIMLAELLFDSDPADAVGSLGALFDERVRHLEQLRLRAAAGWPLWMSRGCDRLRRRVVAHDEALLDMLAGQSGELRRLAAASGRREAAATVLALFSGYKTAGLTLLWSLKALADRPDLLRALEPEAREWTEGGRTTPGLFRARNARSFVREVMRLYPAFPFLLRQARDDDDVLGARKRDVVMISPWIIHRHPLLWSAPLHFDAGRFLSDAFSPLTYLPFGFGQRRCMGANISEQIVIAGLLSIVASGRSFSMSGFAPRGSFILRPDRPVQIRFEDASSSPRPRTTHDMAAGKGGIQAASATCRP